MSELKDCRKLNVLFSITEDLANKYEQRPFTEKAHDFVKWCDALEVLYRNEIITFESYKILKDVYSDLLDEAKLEANAI